MTPLPAPWTPPGPPDWMRPPRPPCHPPGPRSSRAAGGGGAPPVHPPDEGGAPGPGGGRGGGDAAAILVPGIEGAALGLALVQVHPPLHHQPGGGAHAALPREEGGGRREALTLTWPEPSAVSPPPGPAPAPARPPPRPSCPRHCWRRPPAGGRRRPQPGEVGGEGRHLQVSREAGGGDRGGGLGGEPELAPDQRHLAGWPPAPTCTTAASGGGT